jgi:dCMP deaminase
MSLNKEIKYLRLAEEFAKAFSKDQSTQVGMFFLHPTEYTILGAGYNGFPRGCNDALPARHERPAKYLWSEHSETNGIYNAVRDRFRGCHVTAYVPLSVEDVRAIVSVGAVSLVCIGLPDDDVAALMLVEAGVTWTQVAAGSAPAEVRFLRGNTEIASARQAASGPVPGETAVRRAIFEAAKPLFAGSTAVVGPLPPCFQCAKALAAVGVRKVVTNRPSADHEARWGASFQETRGLFSSLGIEMHET